MCQQCAILTTLRLWQVFWSPIFTSSTFPFQNCCLVNLSRVGTSVGHVVVFDNVKTNEENDANYYFKNSNPTEPWIIIPKNRATTDQARTYTECADKGAKGAGFKNAMNDQNKNIKRSDIIKIFKHTLAPLVVDFDYLILPNKDPEWTIDDTAYALYIEKITTLETTSIYQNGFTNVIYV